MVFPFEKLFSINDISDLINSINGGNEIQNINQKVIIKHIQITQ